MNQILLLSIVLAITLNLSHCIKLPPDFKKCNRKDADFKDCVKAAIQHYLVSQSKAPIPEVGLVELNPLIVPAIELKASGSETVSLDQKYKNAKFYGYPNLKVDKFDIDFEKKFMKLEGVGENLRFEADYEAKGKILVLPVLGAGKGKVILEDVKATNYFTFEEFEKDGEKYIKFLTSTVEIIPRKKVTFQFENLFNGNKEISDNINDVMNENWEAVYADTRVGFEETLAKVHLQLANNVFSKVSLKEMFD